MTDLWGSMADIVGWDIGAANVKAAGLILDKGGGAFERIASRPFEIWRDKNRLPEVLREVYALVVPQEHPNAMAVTLTAELSDIFVTKREGVCFVFVPHTTAGITINENADPSVRKDILYELNKMVPHEDDYAHSEGNSAAHIKASLLGFSVSVFVQNSKLQLGTWQGIYFAEFDGPRTRQAWIRIT